MISQPLPSFHALPPLGKKPGTLPEAGATLVGLCNGKLRVLYRYFSINQYNPPRAPTKIEAIANIEATDRVESPVTP